MRRATWSGMCLLAALASAAPPAVMEGERRVERLVAQLGDRDHTKRAAAAKQLEALGPKALPALRKHVNHPDAEVRKRVADLVPSLELAERVGPTVVTLKGKGLTATQALQALGKQAGSAVTVWGDDGREVLTLDLDRVPFWKAVDHVCGRTGLSPAPGYSDTQLRFQKQNGGTETHVAYDGAFRLAATGVQQSRDLQFRRGGDGGRPPVRSQTTALQFTLSSEPRLPMLSVGEPLLLGAVDDTGQSLVLPAPAPDGEGPGMVRRTSMKFGNGYASCVVQGSVSLGNPSDKARAIRSLKALLPVTLLVEQKAEVVHDDVLRARNKKVKLGTTTFHIEGMTRTKDGQYQLKMSATEEGLAANDFTWMNSLYRRIELADEKGNKYQNHGSSWSHNAPNQVDVTFNYGPAGGGDKAGEPRRLTYQVWKTAAYSVKVELKDLPLP